MEDKTPTKIKVELDSFYEDAALWFTSMKSVASEDKSSKTSIFDEEHSGRSKTVIMDEMIDYGYEIVINDH